MMNCTAGRNEKCLTIPDFSRECEQYIALNRCVQDSSEQFYACLDHKPWKKNSSQLHHGCHRHHYLKSPDINLLRIAIHWPKNTKCHFPHFYRISPLETEFSFNVSAEKLVLYQLLYSDSWWFSLFSSPVFLIQYRYSNEKRGTDRSCSTYLIISWTPATIQPFTRSIHNADTAPWALSTSSQAIPSALYRVQIDNERLSLQIIHFRVAFNLCFKKNPGAQLIMRKRVWFARQDERLWLVLKQW